MSALLIHGAVYDGGERRADPGLGDCWRRDSSGDHQCRDECVEFTGGAQGAMLVALQSQLCVLVFPGVTAVLVAMLLKHEAGIFRHERLAIATSPLGTYAAFAGVVAVLGRDEDDRLIAGAMWSRSRQSLANLRGMES